jgi:hypothetical protein
MHPNRPTGGASAGPLMPGLPGFVAFPAALAPSPAAEALAWHGLYAWALDRARAALRPSPYERLLYPPAN